MYIAILNKVIPLPVWILFMYIYELAQSLNSSR